MLTQRRQRSQYGLAPSGAKLQACRAQGPSGSSPAAHSPDTANFRLCLKPKGSPEQSAQQLPAYSTFALAPEPVGALPESAAAFNNCKTPHHPTLPAPGANMLSTICQARSRTAVGSAEHHSAQEDPIVATAWQNRQSSHGLRPRRKPGSKTWPTLNLQQAAPGAPQAGHAHSPHAAHEAASMHAEVVAAALPQYVSHNQQSDARSCEDGPAQASKPTSIAGGPILKRLEGAETHNSKGQETEQTASHSSLQARDRLSGMVQQTSYVMHGDTGELHHSESHCLAKQSEQVQKTANDAFLPQLIPLEGSETQPELMLPGADELPVGTQSEQAADAAKLVMASPPCIVSCDAAPHAEQAASAACENVPDSSGNSFDVSHRHRCHVSQPQDASILYDASHAAEIGSQEACGWHLQLSNPVIVLASCDR